VVINISATLHYAGTPLQVHAVSAKAGIDAMTRTLAVEWGPRRSASTRSRRGRSRGRRGWSGWRPGTLRTKMTAQIPLRGSARSTRSRTRRCSSPAPASAYTTGAVLVVDGGQWLTGTNFVALAD
jgi:peroxisomal 2,4-dienoyl-CoA reductase